MRRSTIIFDVHPWWQTRRGLVVALASVGVLCGIWWMVAWPTDDVPVVPQARAERPAATQLLDVEPASSATPRASALAPAAALPSAQPQRVPAAAPSVSTMVAPGVHITPLSAPPGAVAVPAGPGPDDSESGN